MLITTTHTLSDYKITEYLGIVSGEVVMGTNAFKDIKAALSDVFGGRSASYESSLSKSIDNVLEEMKERAKAMGADAVLGVQHSISTVGNGLLMVVIMGTAVKVEHM